MTHHLTPEPDVIRRATGLVFIDRVYGYRVPRAKAPQTRAANGRFSGRAGA